jgi:uncharacterized membrane protein YphA (DoxX/SURF4 family)
MQQLAERQWEFGLAILNPAQPVPVGLAGPGGQSSLRRFSVYRNNVVVGLIDVLKDAFPAVRRIVGDDFFKCLAHGYIVKEPPRSPILLEYGAGFPAFIAAFEPASPLPYLADVARLERSWTEAYHAPEAAPLDPASLTALAPDDFAGLAFTAHPSLRTVRSQFPALTIWRMNAGDGELKPVDLSAGGRRCADRPPGSRCRSASIAAGRRRISGPHRCWTIRRGCAARRSAFRRRFQSGGQSCRTAQVRCLDWLEARSKHRRRECRMSEANIDRHQPLIVKTEFAIRVLLDWLSWGARMVAPPVLRVALALPFLRSGLTRWDGFLSLAPSAAYLFEQEFKLHILGGEYAIPLPLVAAHVTAMAEIVLPILLILGLATRLSALGLLVMTGVIQLVVPDGWANFHLYWAALALAVIALGAGPLSLDRLIAAWTAQTRRA